MANKDKKKIIKRYKTYTFSQKFILSYYCTACNVTKKGQHNTSKGPNGKKLRKGIVAVQPAKFTLSNRVPKMGQQVTILGEAYRVKDVSPNEGYIEIWRGVNRRQGSERDEGCPECESMPLYGKEVMVKWKETYMLR